MFWNEYPFLTNPITSFLSGYQWNENSIIMIAQTLLFTITIIFFFTPVFIEFNQKKSIIFSTLISLFVLLIKLSLYLFHYYQTKKDELNSTIADSSPGGDIDMLLGGNAAYHINYTNPYVNLNPRPIEKVTKVLFEQCPTVSNIVMSTILAFTASFFVCEISSKNVHYILYSMNCMITAASIYSLLRPPTVDPYSTTINDAMNGFTRPFFITICGVICFFTNNLDKNITIPVFDIDINFHDYNLVVNNVFSYLIVFSPILILMGFIGHPVTTVLWFFEWINMYVFGQSGVSSILDSFINFLRGVVSVVSVSLLLWKKTELWTLTLSLSILFATLQFPLPPSWLHFKSHFIFLVFCILIPPFIIYVVFRLSHLWYRTHCMIVLFSSVFLDWVIPQLLSNQRYFVFHFLAISSIRFVEYLRMLTPLFFAPYHAVFLINNLIPRNLPCWVSAFLLTQMVQLGLCEPHVFTIAVAISFGVIEYDLGYEDNHVRSAFIGLWVARKLFSAYDYFDLLSIFRLYPSTQGLSHIVSCFVVYLLNHVPFADAVVKFPVLLWSLLTGAPFATPLMIYYLILPSPPRPNLFWDSTDTRKMTPEIALKSQLSEHPIEAPVYASASRALSSTLRKMIRSGRLGRVTAGDIFLFECDEIGAFVHIISNNALSTKFQLRGLEYYSQTPCHRSERSLLVNAVSQYKKFPNFEHALQSRVTVFEIRSLGVPIQMYDVVFFGISEAFIGCNLKQIKFLFAVTLCYTLSKYSVDLSSFVPRCEKESLAIYSGILNDIVEGGKVTEEYEKKALSLLDALLSAIVSQTQMKINDNNLCYVFNEEYMFAGDFKWVNEMTPGIKNAFYEAVRLGVLVVTLASADMIPSLEDHAEIVPTLSDIQKENVCTPVNDTRFHTEFEKAQKTLVSLVFRQKKPCFLKFSLHATMWDVFDIKKECVRAFWTNEARSQMFFGEDSQERQSIQANAVTLSNMTIQCCNLPIGYPGFVSPILDSFDFPISH